MSTRTVTWVSPPVQFPYTSVVLADPTNTYGVETQSGIIVVAADTSMSIATQTTAGELTTYTYAYTFTEPAVGLSYNYGVSRTVLGVTLNTGVLTLPADDGIEPITATMVFGAQPGQGPQLTVQTASTPTLQITITNADGSAYSLAGKSIRLVGATDSSGPIPVIDYPNVSVSSNMLTQQLSTTDTATAQVLNLVVWDMTAGYPIGQGYLVIQQIVADA